MQSGLQAPAAEDSHMTPEEIFSLVHHDLALVEEEFDRKVSDVSSVVSSIARYLHDGGGKRVRPALLLSGIEACQRGGVSCGHSNGRSDGDAPHRHPCFTTTLLMTLASGVVGLLPTYSGEMTAQY
jgi:hypothetical protein